MCFEKLYFYHLSVWNLQMVTRFVESAFEGPLTEAVWLLSYLCTTTIWVSVNT